MTALFLVLEGGDNRLMILVLPSLKNSSSATSSPDDLRQDTSLSLSLNSLLFASSKRILRLNVLKTLGGSAYSHDRQSKISRETASTSEKTSSQIAKRLWHAGPKHPQQ